MDRSMLLPTSQSKSKLEKPNDRALLFDTFKNTTDFADASKLRNLESIYSLLFTTVVGDDKLDRIILKNILS